MKNFIEIHGAQTGTARLINISHIVDVIENCIYTDDTPNFATDYCCIECRETYTEICEKIKNATEGGKVKKWQWQRRKN